MRANLKIYCDEQGLRSPEECGKTRVKPTAPQLKIFNPDQDIIALSRPVPSHSDSKLGFFDYQTSSIKRDEVQEEDLASMANLSRLGIKVGETLIELWKKNSKAVTQLIDGVKSSANPETLTAIGTCFNFINNGNSGFNFIVNNPENLGDGAMRNSLSSFLLNCFSTIQEEACRHGEIAGLHGLLFNSFVRERSFSDNLDETKDMSLKGALEAVSTALRNLMNNGKLLGIFGKSSFDAIKDSFQDKLKNDSYSRERQAIGTELKLAQGLEPSAEDIRDPTNTNLPLKASEPFHEAVIYLIREISGSKKAEMPLVGIEAVDPTVTRFSTMSPEELARDQEQALFGA